MILRFIVSSAPSRDCLSNHLIDLRPAFEREAYEHFRVFLRIADLFGSKSFKLFFSQQHDEDIIGDYHAGGGLIGKLLIERETKFGKKLD
jgi:hypothetical protein